MSKDAPSGRKSSQAPTRDDKLKAALKANLQRRKAQARARNQKNNDDKAG